VVAVVEDDLVLDEVPLNPDQVSGVARDPGDLLAASRTIADPANRPTKNSLPTSLVLPGQSVAP
jgi:hypothetical protein